MYITMKLLIKYKRKTAEELTRYCNTYLANEKLTPEQYNELIAMIKTV